VFEKSGHHSERSEESSWTPSTPTAAPLDDGLSAFDLSTSHFSECQKMFSGFATSYRGFYHYSYTVDKRSSGRPKPHAPLGICPAKERQILLRVKMKSRQRRKQAIELDQ